MNWARSIPCCPEPSPTTASAKSAAATASASSPCFYTVIGRVTEAMAAQQPGERVWMTGPLGRGFEVRRTAANLLLIGGGVGIAPLSRARRCRTRSAKTPAAARSSSASAREPPQGVFPAELLPPEVEYDVATEDGSLGHQGFVTDLFRPTPELGRSKLRLRPSAHVPRHVAHRPRRRNATLGPNPDGNRNGLRNRHLLRLRRLHQKKASNSAAKTAPASNSSTSTPTA